MILLIDNFDSFAHNLARYFRRLGHKVIVRRNDAIDVSEVRRLSPQAIALSPGPCTPSEAGGTVEIVQQLHEEFPILGICLGHQTIAAALGARIVRVNAPMHGRTSVIHHQGDVTFAGLPSRFTVCRYHSLVIDPTTMPDVLQTTATCADGTIMALRHRQLPIVGLQFHPESILTQYGFELLNNFLQLANLPAESDATSLADAELRQPPQVHRPLPVEPVTF